MPCFSCMDIMMKSQLFILAAGGVMFATHADAGAVEYTTINGEPAYAVNDATCAAFDEARKAAFKPIESDIDIPSEARGPSGGILLGRAGDYAFEIDPRTRDVTRVTVDARGEVVKTELVDRLATSKGLNVVTVVTGYLSAGAPTKIGGNGEANGTPMQLVIEGGIGQSADDMNQFRHTYDSETLEEETPEAREEEASEEGNEEAAVEEREADSAIDQMGHDVYWGSAIDNE